MTPVHITKTAENGSSACYEIEPLLPGYGVTIGHPLQQALLSLPGAAVTAVCIAGIENVSQKLPGVDEDVMDVTLNCKQIRVWCDSNQPMTLSLDVRGVCEVTAGALTVPDGVEIVNPELHLATLNHAHLVMEVIVTHGKGYMPVPEPPLIVAGTIPLAAMYSPVVKVSYRVERARVGNAVNYDKLVVELTTNGTIMPDEALCLAGEALTRSARALTGKDTQPVVSKKPDVDVSLRVPIPPEVYNRPLNELGLPMRSYNSLRRIGCEKVGHILVMSEEELRAIRNVGDKSLSEIAEALRVAGCLP